jgi:hypothetical protein
MMQSCSQKTKPELGLILQTSSGIGTRIYVFPEKTDPGTRSPIPESK